VSAQALADLLGAQSARDAALIELDLCGVQLDSLPEEICRLTSLQVLRVDGCGLRALPDALWELQALRLLSLAHNRLLELPRELGQLTNLAALIVDGNPALRTIPTDDLAELRLFSAVGCALAQVPFGARQRRALKSLSVERNQISLLAADARAPSHVQWLNAAHNQLAHLPESIGEAHPLLFRLVLGGNQLCWLPDSFAKLPLVELDLSCNRFAALPPAIFSLGRLERLDLTCNQLECVPADVGKLKALKQLWLSDNFLARVDVGALLELRALERLGLATELGGDEDNGKLGAALIDASRAVGAELRGKLDAWVQSSQSSESDAIGHGHEDLIAIVKAHWKRGGTDEGLEEVVASRFEQLPAFIGKLSQLRRLELSQLGGGCTSLPDLWVDLRCLRTLSLTGEPSPDRTMRRRGPLSGGLPAWIGELSTLLYGARLDRSCAPTQPHCAARFTAARNSRVSHPPVPPAPSAARSHAPLHGAQERAR
jgi:hypothetical protein